MEFGHIGIVVKDLERSADFYTSFLECRQQGAPTDAGNVKLLYLDGGGTTLELLQYSSSKDGKEGGGVIDHIAFRVGDIDQWVRKLKEKGLAMDGPHAVPGGHILFFYGPDGERIELVEDN